MAALRKQKITILGGGLSSLVTAHEITSLPGWRDRYEVTVYQMGWRLGGKGASGRNRKHNDRIEEHGLHIFFGFYENAFKVMRGVYQELGRHPDAPLSTWQQAFKKHSFVVAEQEFQGEWRQWALPAPENSDTPGDGSPLLDPWALAQELLALMIDVFDRWWLRSRNQHVTATLHSLDDVAVHIETIAAGDLSLHAHASLLEALGQTVLEQLRLVGKLAEPLASMELGFLHLAQRLAQRMPADAAAHSESHHATLRWLVQRFRSAILDKLQADAALEWEAFQAFTLLDLGLATLLGMLTDGMIIPPVDWQKLDDEDFQAWLVKHGARRSSVDSAPIRGMRSGAFATATTGAAGTSLYLVLRLLFTYKGAILWEMQAGMGDTIFAPLYTVLKRRGVRFEFFQRVDNLELSPPDADGKRRVERVIIGQQATLNRDEYEPLYDVKGLPCWPSEPHYAQLNEGDALQTQSVNLENWWTEWRDPVPPKTLQAGRDFDTVVLGISLGALPYICQELIQDPKNERFRLMVENVQTTLTQATQLWLTPDLPKLGWPMIKPVVVGYTEPFDTWSDMSHLIERENWPPLTVGNIAYFCMCLTDEPGFKPPPRSDHTYPWRQLERVKHNVQKFFERDIGYLWPWATSTNAPGGLNWDWLVDRERRTGVERLKDQYWVADWNPSDRYVLSVSGSTKYRLRPDESGYSNLVLTGDWTRNGFSAGCVEATTASGMHASRAICGAPKHIIGEWMDDLPHHQRHVFEPHEPAPSGSARVVQGDRAGKYFQRDGDLLPLQPFTAKGATLNWFVLGARMDALQKLCDEDLNIAGRTQPVQYRPFLPLVCFVAADIEKLHPRDAEYNKGWMPERDYAFWVPVMAGREVDGEFKAERFGFYNPYMFVDSSPAAEGGREIYGMLKAVSTLMQPKAATDPPLFTVSTYVIPTYGVNTQVVQRELIRIHAPGAEQWGEHSTTWHNDEDVFRELEELIVAAVGDLDQIETSWDLDRDLLRSALTGDTRMISLRQYPDARDGRIACYQAIVETMSVPTSPIRGGQLSGAAYAVDIHPYDSHRIAERLGLYVSGIEGGWQRAESRLHFQLRFDFDLDNGKVVYRSA